MWMQCTRAHFGGTRFPVHNVLACMCRHASQQAARGSASAAGHTRPDMLNQNGNGRGEQYHEGSPEYTPGSEHVMVHGLLPPVLKSKAAKSAGLTMPNPHQPDSPSTSARQQPRGASQVTTADEAECNHASWQSAGCETTSLLPPVHFNNTRQGQLSK